MAKIANAQTVGDLMDRLSMLPRDMLVRVKGGKLGEITPPNVRTSRIMESTVEPGFVADASDRIWYKTQRKGFTDPVEVVLID
jgi:hypothetical protein